MLKDTFEKNKQINACEWNDCLDYKREETQKKVKLVKWAKTPFDSMWHCI